MENPTVGAKLIKTCRVASEAKSRTAPTPMMPLAGLVRR